MFGLKAKDKRNLSRYREDVIDLDDEDIDDYEDYPEDDYEDYPEDEDYPDDDVDDRYEDEEDYPEDEVDDRYEDDYPEDEVDDRYEDDYPEDEDYPERDYADDVRRGQYEDDYPEEADDRYEEDDYPEDEVDDYPEDEVDDYPEDEVDDYPEDEEDYPDEDIDDRYEDEEYPEDNYEEYPEDEDDSEYYPEDSRYDERRERDRRDRHNKRADRDRRDRGESIPAKILNFLANTSATERIAAIFAIVILAGGIATASFYAKAMGNRQQLESFAEIGANMGEETIVGQSGLIAVADAEKARAIAAELVSEDALLEEEEEEVPDDAENVTIKMTLTSIKSDMKVKFINSQTGKLVANLPLEIDVETPDGSKVTYNDHDQDGIIYKKDITAGVYKITPKALPSGYENYKLEIKTQSLTVKDQVEMKAVDVSNEVKKESQVNAAKEDTAVKTEVESELPNTVEWVDSNQNTSEDGNFEYKNIDKNDIVDPSQTAMIGTRAFMFLGIANSGTGTIKTLEEGNTGDITEPGKGATIEDPTIPKDPSPSEGNTGDSSTGGSTEESSGENTGESSGGSTGESSSGGSTGDNTGDNKGKGESEKPPVTSEGTINVKDITIAIDAVGHELPASASNSEKIEYSSESDKIISISGNKIIGVHAGTATVTAKAKDCPTVTFNVTVSKKKFNIPDFSISVGSSVNLTDKGIPSTASVSSDNDNVSVNGLVIKGMKVDKSIITVKDNDYEDYKFTVTVTNADKKVPLGVTTKTLSEGQSFKVEPTEKGVTIKLETNRPDVASVSEQTIIAKKAGDATITVTADGYQSATISIKVVQVTLKDKKGNDVYVEDNGKYRIATSADYFSGKKFFLKVAGEVSKRGWWTINGNTYYYDKNGNYVIGEQVINHVKYVFDSNGALTTTAGTNGIDVSKWNGNIDWKAVKNSGVQFAIIRCGYRGSSAGALIEDPTFRRNIAGAQQAGIRVGVYFFTQAVNEVEAVEEASMVINLIKGYNITYPVYLDVEGSGGRGDGISTEQRTANIKAFCGTIQNAGYKAGVYANKTWFTSKINTPQLTNYKIWLAQYAEKPTYSATRYDMWQCTSKGSVPGISGKVDMNICY